LKNNIRKESIAYDINIFSLSQKGLAYQSVIGEGGAYDFTDLGFSVVCFGIEYDKMDCNKDLLFKLDFPIVVSTGMKAMSNDDVQKIIDKKLEWKEF